MKIAILSPITWRTPPLKYGPWEQIASNIAEGMVEKGLDVTLFATGQIVIAMLIFKQTMAERQPWIENRKPPFLDMRGGVFAWGI